MIADTQRHGNYFGKLNNNPSGSDERLCHRRTKAAIEQARLLIEQAEALGEPSENPLLLLSVLYAFWLVNHTNGDAMRDLAAQFLCARRG